MPELILRDTAYSRICLACHSRRPITFSPRRCLRTLAPRERLPARSKIRQVQRPTSKKLQARLPFSHINAVARAALEREQHEKDGPPNSTMGSKEPVVRWYQQLFPWSKERIVSGAHNPYIDEDDTGEVRKLKEEIDRLDEELRDMQDGKGFLEPLLEDLSPEDQHLVRDHVQARELEHQQQEDAIAEYLPSLEIKWTLPPEQLTY